MLNLHSKLFLAVSIHLLTASCHPHHAHISRQPLPKRWYHSRDHPSHRLFSRAPPTEDTTQYAEVGSPEWATGYPDQTPEAISRIPQAWVDALTEAMDAGKIPDIPPSVAGEDGLPKYDGRDPNGAEVCSATYQCRIESDTWDAPDGVFASSFDDGPQPSSTKLVQFLKDNNAKTTHFMIGFNILNNPQQFKESHDAGHAIAVHTWSHRQMTTLNNIDVLGELGWTMQMIHNSTGGRVPRFWRPPTGDTDRRVSAIAKEVFGLETIIWNHDPRDWTVSINGTTQEKIVSDVTGWLDLPKSPGLMVLEHEIVDTTVDAFIEIFPQISQKGWRFESLADVVEGGAYQNVDGDKVLVAGVLANSEPSLSSVNAAVTNTGSATFSSQLTVGATKAGSVGAQATSGTGSNAATENSPNAGVRLSVLPQLHHLLLLFGLLGLSVGL